MHLDDNGQPIWVDGDVVRVAFKRKRTEDLSDEYTYVRSQGHWPGEAFWSTHTDVEMTAAWNEGRLASMLMTEGPSPDEMRWPGQRIEPGVNGVWCAYHRLTDDDLRVPDGISFVLDGCVLFLDELAAYRYAHRQRTPGWTVGFVAWDTPIAETYPTDT